MSSFSATTQKQPNIPAEFVYLDDVIPDLVQDIRYFSADNFIGEPITGYDVKRLVATAEAAVALQKIQRDLAYGSLAVKVFDAYRPQRAVDHFTRWALDPDDVRRKEEYYPHLHKEELFPSGYLVEFSTHSRGSTLDLTLIDRDSGTELDMGTPFDFFDPASGSASKSVTPQQRANRMLLRAVMTKHGFVPVDEEWWHFTLANEPYPDTWFDFPIR